MVGPVVAGGIGALEIAGAAAIFGAAVAYQIGVIDTTQRDAWARQGEALQEAASSTLRAMAETGALLLTQLGLKSEDRGIVQASERPRRDAIPPPPPTTPPEAATGEESVDMPEEPIVPFEHRRTDGPEPTETVPAKRR